MNYGIGQETEISKTILNTQPKSEALEYLSMATGFVGLGGLGLTVGLIASSQLQRHSTSHCYNYVSFSVSGFRHQLFNDSANLKNGKIQFQ